jgi:hypothetical protein
MDHWLKTGSLKKTGNTKQNQLHNNKETDGGESTSGIKDKLQKKCKYDDCYLRFGFMGVGDSNVLDAQCILCHRTLGNSSMVPAKLQQPLHTKLVD